MPAPTLEQRRAQDAWNRCAGNTKDNKPAKEYVNLAKGLPALVMNSGLMQVMAFLHTKGGTHEALAGHLRDWLHGRFKVRSDFKGFMEDLMVAKPHEFRAITAEALAWLKWLRQMAAARQKGN